MDGQKGINLDNMQSRNYSVFLILLYLWILITNPQSRFLILGYIHIEKIVMIVSWIVLFLRKKTVIRTSKMTFLILALYLVMITSYLLSPYQDFFQVQHWLENYWKLIILFFLIVFSIRDLKDISTIFTGIVVILFLYQAHSWYDFLHGGSYVWQQGIKRIVGIWSGGIGAANYYGMITLYSLPFALFWFRKTEKSKMKIFLICYFVMSFFSIVYSGTRAAILGFIFFFPINIRRLKHFKVGIVAFIILSCLFIFAVPDYLKHRYFHTIPFMSKEETIVENRFDEMARGSALSRFTGLVDGWELAQKRPIFGYGPGSSPLARKEVNIELLHNSESDYQAHNLYGQVLGEIGFLGAILCFLIISIYFYQLHSIKDITQSNTSLYNYNLTFQNSMLLLLFYGLGSHSLYRYYWFLLFGCHTAFIDIISKSLKEGAGASDLIGRTP